MTVTRREVLRGAALALPLALVGCAPAVRTLPGSRLTMRGGWGQNRLLARVETALAEARAAMVDPFGPPPEADLEVRLVHAFSSPAGAGAAARYRPRDRVIEVLLGDGPDPLGDPADFRACLWHEYVHFVLDELAAGEPLPPWLDEGMAEYYGKYRSGVTWSPRARGGEFLAWIAERRVPRLAELNRLFFAAEHARAYTAYAFACSAVARMVERFGSDAPVTCLAAIRRHYTVGGALKRHYHTRLADFEADWQATLVDRYAA